MEMNVSPTKYREGGLKEVADQKRLTAIVGWSGLKEVIGSDVVARLGSRPFDRWGRVSAVCGRVLGDWRSWWKGSRR